MSGLRPIEELASDFELRASEQRMADPTFVPVTMQYILELKSLSDHEAQFRGPNGFNLRLDLADWTTLCRPVELRVTLVDNREQLRHDAEQARNQQES